MVWLVVFLPSGLSSPDPEPGHHQTSSCFQRIIVSEFMSVAFVCAWARVERKKTICMATIILNICPRIHMCSGGWESVCRAGPDEASATIEREWPRLWTITINSRGLVISVFFLFQPATNGTSLFLFLF